MKKVLDDIYQKIEEAIEEAKRKLDYLAPEDLPRQVWRLLHAMDDVDDKAQRLKDPRHTSQPSSQEKWCTKLADAKLELSNRCRRLMGSLHIATRDMKDARIGIDVIVSRITELIDMCVTLPDQVFTGRHFTNTVYNLEELESFHSAEMCKALSNEKLPPCLDFLRGVLEEAYIKDTPQPPSEGSLVLQRYENAVEAACKLKGVFCIFRTLLSDTAIQAAMLRRLTPLCFEPPSSHDSELLRLQERLELLYEDVKESSVNFANCSQGK